MLGAGCSHLLQYLVVLCVAAGGLLGIDQGAVHLDLEHTPTGRGDLHLADVVLELFQ